MSGVVKEICYKHGECCSGVLIDEFLATNEDLLKHIAKRFWREIEQTIEKKYLRQFEKFVEYRMECRSDVDYKTWSDTGVKYGVDSD